MLPLTRREALQDLSTVTRLHRNKQGQKYTNVWPTTEQLIIMEQLKATQMNCLLAYLSDLTPVEEKRKARGKTWVIFLAEQVTLALAR